MVELAKKVLKNTLFNSSSIIVRGVGGLIFSIVLARLLHPELFGMYHLSLSVAFILLTFTDLGVNRTMVRYVSYALGKGDKTLARSFFRYLLKIKFLLAFFPSVALILLAEPLATYVFHESKLTLPLRITGVFLFFFSFLDFVSAAFESLQEFKYVAVKQLAYEGLRLIIIPLLVLLGYSVYGALAGLTIAVIFTLLILLISLLKKHPYLFKGNVVGIDKRRILRFLGYLTFSTLIAGLFFHHIDAVMLGILMTPKDVGYYRAAFNVVVAFMGLVSATTVLFPVFTQLEGAELKNAFRKTFRYLSMLAFPCAFGLASIANPVIRVVYGEEYLPAILPFYVLCLIIAITPMDFFGTLFGAKEKPEYPAVVTIIASLANVILNYVFILNFGVVGAAIATVSVRYFAALSLALLSKRVLGILPDMDAVYKPLFSSLIMLAFLYFLPEPVTILDGLMKIIAAAIVYILTMFLIKGINKEDVRYFSTIFGQEKRLEKLYKW
mgnify:CR=1 FL=1